MNVLVTGGAGTPGTGRAKTPTALITDTLGGRIMRYLGIEYQMKHPPRLDPTFVPFGVWREAYLKGAQKPLAIALERDKGRISVHRTFIHGTDRKSTRLNSSHS